MIQKRTTIPLFILLLALLTNVWRTTAQTPRTPTDSTTIAYSYDNAGRLTGATYGDGDIITYTYDNNGNLLQRLIAAGVPTAIVLQQKVVETPPLMLWLLVSVGVLGGVTLLLHHRKEGAQ